MKVTHQFDELIISSGGVKGYLMLGALKELDQHHPVDKFTYYTGSSMGSLLSAILAVGCTIEEMEAILVEIEWFDFFDIKIRHFLEEMGFIETCQLQQYFKAVFSYKNLSPTITFQELYEQTGKVLTVAVTNVSKRIGEYHCYKTTPNQSILQSLIMSISIPIVFKPIRYNGSLYSDGGIVNHFPYYYHKDTKKMGICLTDRNLFDQMENIPESENPLVSYIIDIMSSMQDEMVRMKMREKKTKNTIFILDDSNGADMKISKEHKYKMMEKGIFFAKKYYEKEIKKRRRRYLIQKYIHLWKSKIVKKEI